MIFLNILLFCNSLIAAPARDQILAHPLKRFSYSEALKKSEERFRRSPKADIMWLDKVKIQAIKFHDAAKDGSAVIKAILDSAHKTNINQLSRLYNHISSLIENESVNLAAHDNYLAKNVLDYNDVSSMALLVNNGRINLSFDDNYLYKEAHRRNNLEMIKLLETDLNIKKNKSSEMIEYGLMDLKDSAGNIPIASPSQSLGELKLIEETESNSESTKASAEDSENNQGSITPKKEVSVDDTDKQRQIDSVPVELTDTVDGNLIVSDYLQNLMIQKSRKEVDHNIPVVDPKIEDSDEDNLAEDSEFGLGQTPISNDESIIESQTLMNRGDHGLMGMRDTVGRNIIPIDHFQKLSKEELKEEEDVSYFSGVEESKEDFTEKSEPILISPEEERNINIYGSNDDDDDYTSVSGSADDSIYSSNKGDVKKGSWRDDSEWIEINMPNEDDWIAVGNPESVSL